MVIIKNTFYKNYFLQTCNNLDIKMLFVSVFLNKKAYQSIISIGL